MANSKLTIDVSQFIKGMQQATAATQQFAQNAASIGAASAQFSTAGKDMANVARQMSQAGTQTIQTLNQLSRNFSTAATSIHTATSQISASLGAIRTQSQASVSSTPFDGMLTTMKALIAFEFGKRMFNQFEQAVEGAAAFQRQIGLIKTITTDMEGSQVTFDQWASGLRRVSEEMGKPATEVAAGAYDLLSNQVTKGAETFGIMSKAGEFARVTNSKASDSVDLLSTAINTFKLNTSDASKVLDQFFTVIDLGRVKTEGFAHSGRMYEYGKTAGATFTEINAALIALTQGGLKEDVAMTLLNNVFQKLLNPSKELKEVYKELGFESGDMFVKTYTLAGAMEKLKEMAGGSEAAMGKFFNEMRGFQGAANMLDRMSVMKDAMDQLEGSTGKVSQVVAEFDKVPGQKFAQEMEKLKNYWQESWSEPLLRGVMKLIDGFGGADKAVNQMILRSEQAAITMGAMFALGSLQAWLASANSVPEILAKIGLAAKGAQSSLGVVGVGLAIGMGLGEAWAQAEAAADEQAKIWDTAHKTIQDQLKEEDKAESERRNRSVEDYVAGMEKQKRAILNFVAAGKRALTELNKSSEETSKAQHDTLKNSLENVLASMKSAQQETINKQHEALRKIRDGQKELRHLPAEQSSALFSLHKAELATVGNYAQTPEEKEALQRGAQRDLYQKRINELTKQAHGYARAGDKEEAIKNAKEIQQLMAELASQTATNPYTGQTFMVYRDGEQKLIEAYKLEKTLIDEVTAALGRRAKKLEDDRLQQAEQVKAAEDAVKNLWSLTPRNSKGTLQFKSLQEFEQEWDKRQQTAVQALRQIPGYNILETHDLFDKRRKAAEAEIRKTRDADRGVMANEIQQERLTKQQQDVEQNLGTNAQQRIRAQNLEADKRLADYSKARTQAGSYAEAYFQNADWVQSGLEPDFAIGGQAHAATKSYNLNREGLVQKYKEAFNKNDYEEALKYVEELIKATDLYNAKMNQLATSIGRAWTPKKMPLGPGGQELTERESLLAQRASLQQTVEAKDQYNTANEAVKATQAAGNPIQLTTQGLITKYGDVSDASNRAAQVMQQDFVTTSKFVTDLTAHIKEMIEQLNALKKVAPNPPSQGETAKGFASGGVVGDYFQARGTDVVPAMLGRDEIVMNAGASNRFKSQLIAMNHGLAPTTSKSESVTVGDINVTVQGGNTSQLTIREIASGLQREIRRGTFSFK